MAMSIKRRKQQLIHFMSKEEKSMRMLNVVNGPQQVSVIVQGCMRMPALSTAEAARVTRNAYDLGE